MPDARAAVGIMRDVVVDAHSVLVQYAISTMPTKILKELLLQSNLSPLDMEVSNESPFIPIASFEQFLKKDHDYLDANFIGMSIENSFQNLLQFPIHQKKVVVNKQIPFDPNDQHKSTLYLNPQQQLLLQKIANDKNNPIPNKAMQPQPQSPIHNTYSDQDSITADEDEKEEEEDTSVFSEKFRKYLG